MTTFNAEAIKELLGAADETLEVPDQVIEGLLALHEKAAKDSSAALEKNRNKVKDQLGRTQAKLRALEEAGVTPELASALGKFKERFGEEVLADPEALERELDGYEVFKKRGDDGGKDLDPTEVERRAQEIAENQRRRHQDELNRLKQSFSEQMSQRDKKITELDSLYNQTRKTFTVREALKKAGITDQVFQDLLLQDFVGKVQVQESEEGTEAMTIDHDPVEEYIGRWAQGDGRRFVTVVDSSGADPRRLDDARGKKVLPSKPWRDLSYSEKARLAEEFTEEELRRYASRN